jgi:hypothetical protein
MSIDEIAFRDITGFKYVLEEQYQFETGWALNTSYHVEGVVLLERNGRLTIRPGFYWDGPSGPAFDTPNLMRASLVHDAVFRLMREAGLPQLWRLPSDELFRSIAVEDGTDPALAQAAEIVLNLFGGSAAKPSDA